jgi:hypothetical protein
MQNILDSTLLNQKCFLFLWFGERDSSRHPPALDGDLRQELDDYLDRRENEVETMTTISENYEEESSRQEREITRTGKNHKSEREKSVFCKRLLDRRMQNI